MERDDQKLQEGRKTSMRKSVLQAYERAIMHRNQVERGGSRDSDDDDVYEDVDDDARVKENGNDEDEEEESENEDVDNDNDEEHDPLEENGFV